MNQSAETQGAGQAPLFTVIVLSYHSKEYIHQALASVFAQDYPRIQLLVADDGSRDFDREHVEGLVMELAGPNITDSLVIHQETNQGTVKNINAALRHSNGNYIKLLAADDALHDAQVLSKAAQAFLLQNCHLLLCSVQKCDQDLKPLPGVPPQKPLPGALLSDPGRLYASLCRKNNIMAGSVFIAQSLFDRLGAFDDCYRLLEDWPMWLKAAREGLIFGRDELVAVNYRTNQGVSSGYHPAYIQDKQYCFQLEIKPNRQRIGLVNYGLSFLLSKLTNSKILRRLLK